MAMVSMKIKQEEGENELEMKTPEYGYGTKIDLEEEQVAALGITQLPPVGTVMKVNAMVVVTKTQLEDDGEGKERYLCLQITDLELAPSGEKKDPATIMYGDAS